MWDMNVCVNTVNIHHFAIFSNCALKISNFLNQLLFSIPLIDTFSFGYSWFGLNDVFQCGLEVAQSNHSWSNLPFFGANFTLFLFQTYNQEQQLLQIQTWFVQPLIYIGMLRLNQTKSNWTKMGSLMDAKIRLVSEIIFN